MSVCYCCPCLCKYLFNWFIAISFLDTRYKLRQLFVRNQICEIFPTTLIFTTAYFYDSFFDDKHVCATTRIYEKNLCDNFFDDKHVCATSTFVRHSFLRNFLVRHAFLCDKRTVNGELHANNGLGKLENVLDNGATGLSLNDQSLVAGR